MTKPPNEKEPILVVFWKMIVRRQLPLETETAWFILVSILDFVITYRLIYFSRNFVESNMIARFFIDSWGPRGLLYFKIAMVTFVVLIVQVIAHKRLETARNLLRFAIIVVGAVVIYSAMLLVRSWA